MASNLIAMASVGMRFNLGRWGRLGLVVELFDKESPKEILHIEKRITAIAHAWVGQWDSKSDEALCDPTTPLQQVDQRKNEKVCI